MPMVQKRSLQVTYLWNDQILGYRLLGRHDRVTIGDREGVTFATPRPSGFPRRFALICPVRDGFRLRVGPGMSGELILRGQQRTVGDILTQPAIRGFLRDPGMFREVEIYPGDSVILRFDDMGTVEIRISYADAPEVVPRPPFLRDLAIVRTSALAFSVTMALYGAIRVLTAGMPSPTAEISQERFAKVVAPALERPKHRAAEARRKAAVAEDRRLRDKEAAESRRAREREGRLGRADAEAKETVLPKGREDVLRAKVARTGLLAALGSARPPGSGLGRLFRHRRSVRHGSGDERPAGRDPGRGTRGRRARRGGDRSRRRGHGLRSHPGLGQSRRGGGAGAWAQRSRARHRPAERAGRRDGDRYGRDRRGAHA